MRPLPGLQGGRAVLGAALVGLGSGPRRRERPRRAVDLIALAEREGAARGARPTVAVRRIRLHWRALTAIPGMPMLGAAMGAGHEPQMELTAEQEAFVRHQRGAAVLHAPVGTGKTLCLAERAAIAIRRGAPASRILCVTFTNLAAEQMRKRSRPGAARRGRASRSARSTRCAPGSCAPRPRPPASRRTGRTAGLEIDTSLCVLPVTTRFGVRAPRGVPLRGRGRGQLFHPVGRPDTQDAEDHASAGCSPGAPGKLPRVPSLRCTGRAASVQTAYPAARCASRASAAPAASASLRLWVRGWPSMATMASFSLARVIPT